LTLTFTGITINSNKIGALRGKETPFRTPLEGVAEDRETGCSQGKARKREAFLPLLNFQE